MNMDRESVAALARKVVYGDSAAQLGAGSQGSSMVSVFGLRSLGSVTSGDAAAGDAPRPGPLVKTTYVRAHRDVQWWIQEFDSEYGFKGQDGQNRLMGIMIKGADIDLKATDNRLWDGTVSGFAGREGRLMAGKMAPFLGSGHWRGTGIHYIDVTDLAAPNEDECMALTEAMIVHGCSLVATFSDIGMEMWKARGPKVVNAFLSKFGPKLFKRLLKRDDTKSIEFERLNVAKGLLSTAGAGARMAGIAKDVGVPDSDATLAKTLTTMGLAMVSGGVAIFTHLLDITTHGTTPADIVKGMALRADPERFGYENTYLYAYGAQLISAGSTTMHEVMLGNEIGQEAFAEELAERTETLKENVGKMISFLSFLPIPVNPVGEIIGMVKDPLLEIATKAADSFIDKLAGDGKPDKMAARKSLLDMHNKFILMLDEDKIFARDTNYYTRARNCFKTS
jgi:hypothetical protein